MALGRDNRIAVLDGYRALAVSLVLFYHYTVRWAFPHDPINHFPPGESFNGVTLFEYGWLGVELFFVISGFVILMTLERCQNVLDFGIRRFARLWPPLVVAASLTAGVVFLIGPPDWKVSWESYLSSILLIPPALIGKLLHYPYLNWVDGAYWSLWVEARFYVLACFCYWVARKNFVRLWLGLQAIITILTLVAYVARSHVLNGVLELTVFLPYFPYFTIGICLYEIYSGGANRRLASVGAGLTGAAILMAAAIGMNIYAGQDPWICTLANVLFLSLFLLFDMQAGIISIFAAAPVALIGRASYSIYLLHQFIRLSAMRWLMSFGISYAIALPITVVSIVSVAIAMFHFIEVPAKSFLMRETQGWISRIEIIAPLLSFRTGRQPPSHIAAESIN
jgi:peptidoglycan/LPS O-acetylase OafA/YrhL